MNLKVKKVSHFRGHEAAIYTLTAGRKPGTVITAGADGHIVEWAAERGDEGKLLAEAGSQLFSARILPDGHTLLAGRMKGDVLLLDLAAGRLAMTLSTDGRSVFSLAASGPRILAGTAEGFLYAWHKDTGQLHEKRALAGQSVRAILPVPGRSEIFLASSDQHIYILDAETLGLKHRWKAHEHSVFCLLWLPGRQWLVSGGRDAVLRIWDAGTAFEPLHAIPAHRLTINDLAVAGDEELLVSAGRDKEVRIWSLDDYQLLKVIQAERDGGHRHSVNALHYDPQSALLYSAGDDRQVIAWQIDRLRGGKDWRR